MSFTVSEELVQKITPKSYTALRSDKASQFIGERILLAIDVIGGLESRLNHFKGFKEFNLFEHESFLGELASTISYDNFGQGAGPSSLKNDSYLLEIADLVKRDLYQWVKKQNEVNFNWGYVKASDCGDLIISPKIK